MPPLRRQKPAGGSKRPSAAKGKGKTGDSKCSEAASAFSFHTKGNASAAGMALAEASKILGGCRSKAHAMESGKPFSLKTGAAASMKQGSLFDQPARQQARPKMDLGAKVKAAQPKFAAAGQVKALTKKPQLALPKPAAAPVKENRFSLKQEPAARAPVKKFENNATKPQQMFDQKKGDLKGQTSFLDSVRTVEMKNSGPGLQNNREKRTIAGKVRAAQEGFQARMHQKKASMPAKDAAVKAAKAVGRGTPERLAEAKERRAIRAKPPWMMTVAELRANHVGQPQNNSMTPWSGNVPRRGTWAMEPGSANEVVQMRKYDPKKLVVTEDETSGRKWHGFDAYQAWAKEGRQPPPIEVVRNADTGSLISMNRRRTLAARDAGRKLMGWFTETDRKTGRTAWKHREMVEAAVKDGRPVPDSVLSDYPELRVQARKAKAAELKAKRAARKKS
jgi:hypothetical protein